MKQNDYVWIGVGLLLMFLAYRTRGNAPIIGTGGIAPAPGGTTLPPPSGPIIAPPSTGTGGHTGSGSTSTGGGSTSTGTHHPTDVPEWYDGGHVGHEA